MQGSNGATSFQTWIGDLSALAPAQCAVGLAENVRMGVTLQWHSRLIAAHEDARSIRQLHQGCMNPLSQNEGICEPWGLAAQGEAGHDRLMLHLVWPQEHRGTGRRRWPSLQQSLW